MELQLKPNAGNSYPLQGILLKEPRVSQWVQVFQEMELNLKSIPVYPVPNTELNSIWGCFILVDAPKSLKLASLFEYCQRVNQFLFIPEQTQVFPQILESEMRALFGSRMHLMHPEFGMVELLDAVDWKTLLEAGALKPVPVTKPVSPPYIPKRINSFRVESVSPEQVLRQLEGDFPSPQKMQDKPLDLLEKGRLMLYGKIFTEDGQLKGNQDMSEIFKEFGGLFRGGGDLLGRMKQDFEDLNQRNQKQIDRLMDLLKKNPLEALKYAIPLDEKGSGRGGNFSGDFTLSKRWGDFSLFGNTGWGSASGSLNIGDHYHRLRKQYRETAEDLIKKGEYQKAAFIYLKLLDNPTEAAKTLEKGHLYQEAATVYLKYLKNKKKAAECYEKGHYYKEAIDLYIELGMNEKAGDLYTKIGQLEAAFKYYSIAADLHKKKGQFVKAALIYRKKMFSPELGQDALLEGWRTGKDSINCLNNYFYNIEDIDKLWDAIQAVYKKEVPKQKQVQFLRVLTKEYKKANAYQEGVRSIAYEIIADEIKTNPNMASELLAFNPVEKALSKDTILFRNNRF